MVSLCRFTHLIPQMWETLFKVYQSQYYVVKINLEISSGKLLVIASCISKSVHFMCVCTDICTHMCIVY